MSSNNNSPPVIERSNSLLADSRRHSTTDLPSNLRTGYPEIIVEERQTGSGTTATTSPSNSQPGSRFNSIRRNISNTARQALSSIFPNSRPVHYIATANPPPYHHNVIIETSTRRLGNSHQHYPTYSGPYQVLQFPSGPHERLPSYKSLHEETTVFLDRHGDVVSVGRTDRVSRPRRARSQGARQPLLSTVHDVTASVDTTGRVIIRSAPRCTARQHVYVDDYSCCGILCAILFFPIGIICCHACCRTSVCFYCGHEYQ